MPFQDLYGEFGRDESKRIAAWRAHYAAKGCHPVKADQVARRKCRRSYTWPPA